MTVVQLELRFRFLTGFHTPYCQINLQVGAGLVGYDIWTDVCDSWYTSLMWHVDATSTFNLVMFIPTHNYL